uniref:endonuclease V isoform X2 n=1 Tax=Ciona intestinalis TaxID=7719 RepID=UPI000180D222|nr:endonuclease V isoform X2 [Ciona intestinalis]6OZH_A Chain A, endonuclease V isoform X2 [Ciona intestinalis]6OZH_B Chain B, endonuclease V isoform X2 [Ciona intestinalis]6OZH_C Chain C, endonuclease V isoform X2 [Ciona intestinalis]6OZH_D Chain D, endonuclease V isoform X2 [Ciona intestinalis]|eukprot:XP_026692171.1 endonuclease V isoform X2 [Ciona intestinalis]
MDNKITDEQIAEWNSKQEELRDKIIRSDGDFSLSKVKYVGGFDVSYSKINHELAVSCMVVLSYPEMKQVYMNTTKVKLSCPYKSSYLAFREIEPFQQELQLLKAKKPNLEPQVFLLDGNGFFHIRRCGAASHLGVLSNTRTIGVAKSLIEIPEDGVKKTEVISQFKRLRKTGGNELDIISTEKNEVLAKAVLYAPKVEKPIFVSAGHKCSLETAAKIVKGCTKTRIPEPIKMADKWSRKELKKIE